MTTTPAPIDLQPRFERRKGMTIVTLPAEGVVQPQDVQQVCSHIDQAIADAPARHDFLLSFKQVHYISSLFIGRLMSFYKHLAQKQSRLLLCEMQPPVEQVIRLAGLERQLPIYPNRSQAITGRTPALAGLVTVALVATLAGVGLLAKSLMDGSASIGRIVAMVWLLLHLPMPGVLWWFRREISSLPPRLPWLILAGATVMVALAALLGILAG